MKQTIKAKIYGDSIMKGTILDGGYRYHATFDSYLARFAKRFNIEAENRARFGITIDKGYKLLRQDIESGLDCDFALIEFGGNDSNFHWDEISLHPETDHEPLTDFEHFKQTCRSMIADVISADVKPILMTLPPIDSEKYLTFLTRNGNSREHILQWLGTPETIYNFHKGYSDAVASIAAETATPIVDVRRPFMESGNYKELLCIDGVHPNEKGYELIAGVFDRFLQKILADYDTPVTA